jgi:hypothetical protein
MALNLLLPSCSPMVRAPIQELGFLSSPYVNFIMRRTVMPRVLSPRPTPWTALFLVTLPRQMPSLSTTHAISGIMNPTATRSIPIASPLGVSHNQVRWRPNCFAPPRWDSYNQQTLPPRYEGPRHQPFVGTKSCQDHDGHPF